MLLFKGIEWNLFWDFIFPIVYFFFAFYFFICLISLYCEQSENYSRILGISGHSTTPLSSVNAIGSIKLLIQALKGDNTCTEIVPGSKVEHTQL